MIALLGVFRLVGYAKLSFNRSLFSFDRLHSFIFAGYLVSLVSSMSGMELFSTLILICAVIKWMNLKFRITPLPAFWMPVLAFTVIVIIGIILGQATFSQKIFDIRKMRFFLLYGALHYELLYTFNRPRQWIRVLFFSCVVVGIYGFLQHFIALDILHHGQEKNIYYAVPETKAGLLVVGFFNHHLTFSNVFTFYACIFTAVGLYYWHERKRFLGLGLLLFLLLIWTHSKAAWIAIPFMLFTVALSRGIWLSSIFAGSVIALMAILYLVEPGFHQRVSLSFFEKNDAYNQGPRKRLWKAQLEMFKEHPFFGLGYNNNERLSKHYVDQLFPNRKDNFYGHAHSVPMQLLASTGILGFLAYVWIWVAVFTRTIRMCRAFTKDRLEYWVVWGCLSAFIGFQIQSFTQWSFGDSEVLHSLMFFWALISAMPVALKDPIVATEDTR